MPYANKLKAKEYQRKYHREWYQKNKKRRQQQLWARRDRMKKFVFSIKKQHVCNRCGFDNPVALEFHHIDPTIKEFNVGIAAAGGYSKKRLLKEISKCEIICANCHKIEHFSNRKLLIENC